MRLFRIGSRAITRLNEMTTALAAAGLLVMVTLITVDVIARRFFNRPLLITDEVAGYLMVFITFLAMGYTLKEGGHVQIGVLFNRIPLRVRNWLMVSYCILGLAIIIWLAFKSYQLTVKDYTIGAVSSTWLAAPLYLPRMFMFIGLSLFALQFIVEFGRRVSSLRA